MVGVISDRPDAAALQRAQTAGVDTHVVDWSSYPSREAFTNAICAVAGELRPDLIVLAGFMRILSASAISAFPNQIINVHPSLLPAFAGAHAVSDALEHGVKVTGVTVHFVDEELDHGPIIAQQPVDVLVGDDEATLHARIQQVEHELLPAVVTSLARGEIEVAGRKVKGAML